MDYSTGNKSSFKLQVPRRKYCPGPLRGMLQRHRRSSDQELEKETAAVEVSTEGSGHIQKVPTLSLHLNSEFSPTAQIHPQVYPPQ